MHVEINGRYDSDNRGPRRSEMYNNNYALFIYYVKVDLMFVRALIGIRDIDKSGVKEDEFSEVRTGQTSTCHVTCTVLLL